MIDATKIVSHMDVVDSHGVHIGTVDELEGTNIKLSKFDKMSGGVHHWIPLDWITSVDQRIQLDRPRDEVMRSWLSEQRV